MNNKESYASLRIHSKILTSEQITLSLGVKPDRAFNKGEKISSKGKDIRESSMWLLNSNLTKQEGLSEHIYNLLDLLDSIKEKFESIIDKVECDIFCYYSSNNGQGSIELSKQLISRLKNYPVDIVFDIYLSDE